MNLAEQRKIPLKAIIDESCKQIPAKMVFVAILTPDDGIVTEFGINHAYLSDKQDYEFSDAIGNLIQETVHAGIVITQGAWDEIDPMEPIRWAKSKLEQTITTLDKYITEFSSDAATDKRKLEQYRISKQNHLKRIAKLDQMLSNWVDFES